jgi:predicted nucleic acid-binding protein
MAMNPGIDVAAAVLDASFVVAICAREAGSEPIALAELRRLTLLGCAFYAPGVLSAEVLFVLCRMRTDGRLDPKAYQQSVVALEKLLTAILPPRGGEASLITRANALRGEYTCRRTSDSLYLALAEQLSQSNQTVLLTFDKELLKQANGAVPGIEVLVLTRPSGSAPAG